MSTSIRAIQTAANLNEWAVVIAECRQSGQSATEWCGQKGIKPNLYFKWQRKVFDAPMERQGTQLQELPLRINRKARHARLINVILHKDEQ